MAILTLKAGDYTIEAIQENVFLIFASVLVGVFEQLFYKEERKSPSEE